MHATSNRADPQRHALNRSFERGEQFGLLVSAVRDYAIFMLDPEGRVQTWNSGAELIKGYRAEEIIGQSFERFYLPEEVAAGEPRQHLEDARRSGSYRETGLRVRKDGSHFWADVVITALRDEEGRLRGYAKVTRDITAQREQAHALAESEARFRALADNISQLAWMADGKGRVFWYNRRWFDYTGTTLAEVEGWGWTRLHHPEHVDRVVRKIEHAWDTGEAWEDTFPLRGRDGQYRWFLSRAVPIRGPDGRISLWFGTNTDITELEERVRERTAQLADANLEMQAFNYTVSHDLRAPLRGIRGFAELLLEDHSARLDAEGQEYCRRITAAGARMETLLEDLLAYGRLSRTEVSVKPVELEGVVDDALEQLAEAVARSRAQIEVARPLPAVKGHRPILVQAVQNLVANALKFVAPKVRPHVCIRGERRGQAARLYVEDNGIGIAPEHRERIFRVFERLHGDEHYPGTGIGLAIVRRALERLGGRAGIESRGSGGSCFWIELPVP